MANLFRQQPYNALNLHVKCPILLSDSNQTWSFSEEFHNRTESQISWKSVMFGATQIHADKGAERKMRQTRRIFYFNKQGRDIIGKNKIQKK